VQRKATSQSNLNVREITREPLDSLVALVAAEGLPTEDIG